jgi:hypothetical protein
MLVRHKKPFNFGMLLAVSFILVLVMIFSPVFPGGKNGLEYSDDLFNKLSKGSSYFIPRVSDNARKLEGTSFNVVLKMDNPEQVQNAIKIVLAAGAQVGTEGTQLKISGDLGKMLSKIVRDSDAMYKNEGAKVSEVYSQDERIVMSTWWKILTLMHKELQKDKKIEESNVVNEVIKKALEPSYNFYGIEAQRVSDKAGTMTGLLIFYVLYTMWWGYAIFYLFDGLGLSMKKAKVKKEV